MAEFCSEPDRFFAGVREAASASAPASARRMRGAGWKALGSPSDRCQLLQFVFWLGGVPY